MQIDRYTVARQNVWQVLDQRPSRLARRMAVRKVTVTRWAKAVKTYAKGCGCFLHSHKCSSRESVAAGTTCLVRGIRGGRRRGRRRAVQVAVVPGEDAVQAVEQMLFFVEA